MTQTERTKMANDFEKALHTNVDISSLEDFGKWIEIAYEEADKLHRRLCEKKDADKEDKELEDFMLGKITAMKSVKHNFDRAMEFETKVVNIEVNNAPLNFS